MTWRPSGADYEPTGVGTSLEALMKRLGGGSVRTTKDVFDAWAEAVGPEVSVHASPVSLVDGVLNVEVDDARWLTQLKWLGGRVADRLNEACGKEAVERLNMRQMCIRDRFAPTHQETPLAISNGATANATC